MSETRGPGRPSMTAEEAWRSVGQRVEKYLVYGPGEHMVYAGPRQIGVGVAARHLVGGRSHITPERWMEVELGLWNGNTQLAHLYRMCAIQFCINPDHMETVKVGEPAPEAWQMSYKAYLENLAYQELRKEAGDRFYERLAASVRT